MDSSPPVLPPDLLLIHLFPLLPLRLLSSLSLCSRQFRQLATSELSLRWPLLSAVLSPREAFGLCRKVLRGVVKRDAEKVAGLLLGVRRRGRGGGVGVGLEVPWTELASFFAKTLSTELYTLKQQPPHHHQSSVAYSPDVTRFLGSLLVTLWSGSEPGDTLFDVACMLHGSLAFSDRRSALDFIQIVGTGVLNVNKNIEVVSKDIGKAIYAAGVRDSSIWSLYLPDTDPSLKAGWLEERDKEEVELLGKQKMGRIIMSVEPTDNDEEGSEVTLY